MRAYREMVKQFEGQRAKGVFSIPPERPQTGWRVTSKKDRVQSDALLDVPN
ncbi:MAG: hypothetical protein WCO60_05585 [Verrucomicrobiota bacterium]